MRTLLAGDVEGICSAAGEGTTDCSGDLDGTEDSSGVGKVLDLGDSCAAATWSTAEMTQAKMTTRKLSIVTPVHVWKKVVPPFAIAQKFFIDHVGDKLIVQTVETSKMIDRALGRVFAGSPSFH